MNCAATRIIIMSLEVLDGVMASTAEILLQGTKKIGHKERLSCNFGGDGIAKATENRIRPSFFD